MLDGHQGGTIRYLRELNGVNELLEGGSHTAFGKPHSRPGIYRWPSVLIRESQVQIEALRHAICIGTTNCNFNEIGQA